MRDAFLLDPCDPPVGSCANCGQALDVSHIADAEACPNCAANLALARAVVPLTEHERLLWDGRCPCCGLRSSHRQSDDTATLRVDPNDATKDVVLSGRLVCQTCGFEFDGLSQGADAEPTKRRLGEVRKLGRAELRCPAAARLPPVARS